MEQIKIYPDFISQSEIDILINFIESNINNFWVGPLKLRYVLQFGKDLFHGERSNPKLELPEDMKKVINSYFNAIINKVKKEYNHEKELYVASFWFNKQVPGASIVLHRDSDGDVNTHFIFSAIIYLNELSTTGLLEFPNINYSYQSSKGDLVLFPSIDNRYEHEVKAINQDRYTLTFWLTEDPAFAIK